jgi:hypothetical protein
VGLRADVKAVQKRRNPDSSVSSPLLCRLSWGLEGVWIGYISRSGGGGGPLAGSCEHGNSSSGLMKCGGIY